MACLIAAPSSGSGKTLLSLCLAAWARRQGLQLQPFKVGPDYLDPQLLSQVSGRLCRNLDPLLCGPEWVERSFHWHGSRADLALVEGVMGLFDGRGPSSEGSSAAVAAQLGLPVVLVVEASRQAGSVAALVRGFRDHGPPPVRLAGVVLNRVGSERHHALLADALLAIEVPLLMDYFFGVDGFSDMQHEYPKPGLFASKLELKKFVGDMFTASLFSVPSMMVAASINDHGGKAFAAVDTQSLSVGCYGLSKECSDNGWVCHTDDLYCIFDTFSTMEHCDQVGDAGVYGERIRQTIAAFVHDHPVKYDGVALQMPTSSNMRLLTMHGSNPSEIEFYNSRVSAFKRGVEAQLGTFASRATIGREAAERCF